MIDAEELSGHLVIFHLGNIISNLQCKIGQVVITCPQTDLMCPYVCFCLFVFLNSK